MPRRREAGELYESFLEAALPVERAKETLVEAVPTARAPGRPLADALFGFEEALTEAQGRMPSWWREDVAREWEACARGIAEARELAGRLRRDPRELSFEALVGTVEELLAPLDAFADADERLRDRGAP